MGVECFRASGVCVGSGAYRRGGCWVQARLRALNPSMGISCICIYAKMEVAAFLPTCRSSPMSVPRSNVWYASPSLQAHGCWKCPFWRPEHFATLKSRKVQGSIFGSRAVWHLWAMDFSVNRLDRKPSPPRCHLQQRAHLTGCPTF